MAYSREQWDKAKVLFELGHPLQYIADEVGFKDKSMISRRATKEQWDKAKNQQLKSDIIDYEKEKSTIEAKKSTLVEKVAKLSDFEITILDKDIESTINLKSLIFNTQTLAVVRNNQMLTNNSKTVMIKTATYDKDGGRLETYEPYDITLSPSDIKEIVEANDKASITLGVSQRHASTTINNTNAVQNEAPTVVFQRIENTNN